MRCDASIKAVFADADAAKAVAVSLQGIESPAKKRNDSTILVDGKNIIIKISADDVVALRASVNGYLRQLQAIESLGVR